VARLSSQENLDVLSQSLVKWSGKMKRATTGKKTRSVILDFDSTPVRVHGEQSGSTYNGHYGMRCFYPLVAQIRETGDWVGAQLRMGNEHCSVGAVELLQKVIPQVQEQIAPVRLVCGDAGFPNEPMLEWLEQQRIPYVFRLMNNAVLDRMAEPYLKRPPGRPPAQGRRWYVDLEYAAAAWRIRRRIVLVIVERPGELFLDRYVLVTNQTPRQMHAEKLADMYRYRATMESHIGELKNALSLNLSCTNRTKSHVRGRPPVTRGAPRDAALSNQATFLLFALAYNLANAARRIISREIEGRSGRRWSIQKLQNLLLRRPGRIIVSARNMILSTLPQDFALLQIVWKAMERIRAGRSLKLE
jgi:hypothetical protein